MPMASTTLAPVALTAITENQTHTKMKANRAKNKLTVRAVYCAVYLMDKYKVNVWE